MFDLCDENFAMYLKCIRGWEDAGMLTAYRHARFSDRVNKICNHSAKKILNFSYYILYCILSSEIGSFIFGSKRVKSPQKRFSPIAY